MPSRGCSLVATAAIALGLLAGCASRQARPIAGPPPSAAVVNTGEASVLSEADKKRLEEANAARVEANAEVLARYAAGLSYELRGQAEEAIENYHLAAQANPASEELVLQATRGLLGAREIEKALALLKTASSGAEPSGLVVAHYGWVCLQMGRTNEAVAAEQKAIALAPTNVLAYQTLCNIYLEQKDLAAAASLLDHGTRQPDDVVFLIELAELYSRYKKEAPAEADAVQRRMVELLDRALALQPATIGYRMKLADAYNYVGEFQKAVELYLQMQEDFANVPLLRNNIREKLTDLYLRGKDRAKAMEQLEAIVRDNPLNAQAYYYLGGLSFEAKQYGKAAEYLGKTILLNPKFEQGYYDTAAALINDDQPEAALEALDKARTFFPQSFLVEYYSGLALVRLKKYPDAIKAFTAAEVIARVGDRQRLTPVLYFQIGAACERDKRFEQAESYFQKAIDLDANFAEALNYLGYMWAEQGVNLDQAKALLDRALKLEPQNAAFLDSLGWIYFKLGDHERARDHIAKAVELSTEPDPTLLDHLGDVYAALKLWDKARAEWQKSLALEDNATIKQKLENAPKN